MGMKPRTKVKSSTRTTPAEPSPTSEAGAEVQDILDAQPGQRMLNMVEIGVVLLHAIVETMPPWYMAHLSLETQDALKRARESLVARGLLVKRAGD